tara:strand:+ start:58 stop:357 length:300 start_codon:yes stop_codon:yes gene_type:complete
MRLKEGVRVKGIKPEILFAMIVCEQILQAHNLPLIITSATEGRHSNRSLHYCGEAFDFRTNHVARDLKPTVRDECQAALGNAFDVVLEASHMHVEHDPK